jgi:hypothetical protein
MLGRTLVAVGLLACSRSGEGGASGDADESTGAPPWTLRAPSWRTDPVWHDGLAERCVYDATRTIYGAERAFLATAYTDLERADERSTVKTEEPGGVEVFKHHWSERVPTESYDYDFSTACYVRSADLACFKLTAATQEDCGASFKEIWRARRGYEYFESVYFPGTGRRSGTLDGGAVFEDALSLVLRDFPFGEEGDEEGAAHALSVIPSQKDTRAVSFVPLAMEARAGPRETLELPCGSVPAARVDLVAAGEVRARYWFALDGGAPWLHALVRYEGPYGVRYFLRSIERTAYWQR